MATLQHQYWVRFVRHEEKFARRREYIHRNPVKKGRVKLPEDWRWLGHDNVALDKVTVAACPTHIDDVRLPLWNRAREKPTVRKTPTVATRSVRLCRSAEGLCPSGSAVEIG